MKMNFEEFYNVVFATIESAVEENPFVKSVEEIEVTKNNHANYEGIMIRTADEINPTFNITNYYSGYNGTNLDDILSHIVTNVNLSINHGFDMPDILSFNNVKDIIIGQIVNTKWNEGTIENVPHRSYEDLSLVYRVQISSSESGIGTFLISNGLMDQWNISENDLYEAAMKNIENGFIVNSFASILGVLIDEVMDTTNDWKILSCENHIFGAASITAKGKMIELRNTLQSDLLIIPSSIHEVIIIPINSIDIKSIGSLTDIICSVNDTLRDEEVLSDHAYVYTEHGIISLDDYID